MLQGEHGHQNKELEKLVEWAVTVELPDVIVISNLLLTGVVRRLKQQLGRPVVATMQGEAPFLDALPEPFAFRSWQELAVRVRDIDALVPVSQTYGDVMAAKLELGDRPIHVVHNGLELAEFPLEPPPLAARTPPTIGYLARMCRDKGLPTLVEAFAILKERNRIPDLRLCVCGVMLDEDRGLVNGLRQTLADRGCADAVEFRENIGRTEKVEALRSFRVLSVPATYGESFGLYLLEAMVSGVPVVQPRHGAFPEILDATGGGVLCEPDDPKSLADALSRLLLAPDDAQRLADAGRRAVIEHFNSDRMAREFAAVCAET
jgi:glycosyltransferase involved in cell wall biosynthesis